MIMKCRFLRMSEIFQSIFLNSEPAKNILKLSIKSKTDLKKFKEMAIESKAYVVLEVKQKSDLIKSVPIFKNL